jgi:hypothetical protein
MVFFIIFKQILGYLKIGHYCFISCYFQSIIFSQPVVQHLNLYSWENIVKYSKYHQNIWKSAEDSLG